jgi:hypothetical protein
VCRGVCANGRLTDELLSQLLLYDKLTVDKTTVRVL